MCPGKCQISSGNGANTKYMTTPPRSAVGMLLGAPAVTCVAHLLQLQREIIRLIHVCLLPGLVQQLHSSFLQAGLSVLQI